LGDDMNDRVAIRVAEAADVPAVLRIYSQPAVDAGAALSNEAAQSNCYKLTLSAAGHRANAHQFYESRGFERHGYNFRVTLDA
jgi:hypothetical protein